MKPISSSMRAVALGALATLFLPIAFAQDAPVDILPGLKDRAVVMDIVARIVERDQSELWTSQSSKVTIPGRAVSLKLVGKNVVVVAQFTPYKRDDGRQVLVAQGQVWIEIPGEGVRYQTTMQTIPLDFGERVFFFPLGPRSKDGKAAIEIQLELSPYKEDAENSDNPDETKTPGTTQSTDKKAQ